MPSAYNVSGIDVHKAMVAVAVADVSEEEQQFRVAKFATTASGLRELAAWLKDQQASEVVMESTAQYWYAVWLALEKQFRVHLAQAHSNAAPCGRKSDYADAKRLVRRFVAQELRLSFVPEAEQRNWRCLTQARYQLTRERVRVHNHIESLLEQMQIKLSAFLTDLLGVSGRRILAAIAQGESDPERLAALADARVRASRATLIDALSGTVSACHRQLLRLHLERLVMVEQHIHELEQSLEQQLAPHQQAIQRLLEVPGIGLHAAHEILAQIGPQAQAFASAAQLASWVGVCPGRKESAGVSRSDRSPKGNRAMRRVLAEVAQAAIKTKDSCYQHLFRKLVARLGFKKTVWAIAHRLCNLVWKILHDNVRYQGTPKRSPQDVQRRAKRLLQQLRTLGFDVRIQLPQLAPGLPS